MSFAGMTAVAAAAVVFGLMQHVSPNLCPNDNSRWDTIWSLVERGTYVIDDAPWAGTIDKVKRDGHFYSSKPALLPTILAGEYWLIKKLTGKAMPDDMDFVARVILLTVNVIPLGIYVWLFGAFLVRHVEDVWWRSFWLFAAAFGTYVTGYCVTLTNHTVGAFSALFALYAAVRIIYDEEPRPVYFAICGFFAACAFANELPAAALGLALFAWLVYRHPKLTLLWFVPAGLIPVAGFVVTTHLSTGGFVPYYLLKHTALYHYEGSYWNHPVGIDAQSEPKWLYLLHMTVGHHGIFSLSPIFIFTVVGIFVGLRRPRVWPGLNVLVIIVTAVCLGIYVVRTGNYGGGCQGLRWTFWLIPLWLMTAALTADVYGRSAWVKALAVAALAVSVFSMAYAAGNPWSTSWVHEVLRGWGWVGY